MVRQVHVLLSTVSTQWFIYITHINIVKKCKFAILVCIHVLNMVKGSGMVKWLTCQISNLRINSHMGSNEVTCKPLFPWASNLTLLAQYWLVQEFFYKLKAFVTIKLKSVKYKLNVLTWCSGWTKTTELHTIILGPWLIDAWTGL